MDAASATAPAPLFFLAALNASSLALPLAAAAALLSFPMAAISRLALSLAESGGDSEPPPSGHDPAHARSTPLVGGVPTKI